MADHFSKLPKILKDRRNPVCVINYAPERMFVVVHSFPVNGLLVCTRLSAHSTVWYDTWQAGAGKTQMQDIVRTSTKPPRQTKTQSTLFKCLRIAVVNDWLMQLHAMSFIHYSDYTMYFKCGNINSSTTHTHTYTHTHTHAQGLQWKLNWSQCTVIYSRTQKSFMQINGFPCSNTFLYISD